ncbi:MAG: DUF5063 domain-containing protein [Bacteroidales bacterium]|nr:DUF5063 domain-containing protein [Bacteroidales bacterium]
MSDNDPTLSRNILELVTIATEFCNLIENSASQSKADLLGSLQSFAPLLYLRGTLIPAIQPDDIEYAERFVTEEQWESIFRTLRDKLGKDDEFWILEDQTENNEPIKASISECVADTYQDLKDFVTLFKKNRLSARENAIHDIKQLFETNWGKKIIIVLPVIHKLRSNPVSESNIDTNSFDFND